jgi:hypothetical protein
MSTSKVDTPKFHTNVETKHRSTKMILQPWTSSHNACTKMHSLHHRQGVPSKHGWRVPHINKTSISNMISEPEYIVIENT